ncbi:MAG: DNA gyrase inhibitor YacG [Rhodospirillales bacterium]
MNADPKSKKKAKVVPLKGSRCPICSKPATLEMRPFCSKRCADLDLGRWLDGEYRMPTDEAPGDAEAGLEDDEQA